VHHVTDEERPRSGFFAKARGKGVDLEALSKEIMEREEQRCWMRQIWSLLLRERSTCQPSPRLNDAGSLAGTSGLNWNSQPINAASRAPQAMPSPSRSWLGQQPASPSPC
jgi:hypothetical protein